MAKELSGRAKGGIARRDALKPEERQKIAKKAALTRWGARAIHRGNFRDHFGIDIDCYVLNDPTKTPVISQRGMGPWERLTIGSGDHISSSRETGVLLRSRNIF